MPELDWPLLVGLLTLLAMAGRARTEALIAGDFVFFTIVWRLLAATVVDGSGPFWSSQLERYIGGDGGGAVYLFAWALTGLLVILPFAASGAPVSALAPARVTRGATLGDLAFWAAFLFLVALYGDMLQRGTIPLFEGMERYDYARNVAGPLHLWLFEYGGVVAFALGMFCVMGARMEARLDLRFIGLIGMLYVYAFLTGHRLSAFYVFFAYFLMPFSAIPLSARLGCPIASRLPARQLKLLSWPALAVAVCAAATLVAVALLNSYLTVRAADEDAISKVIERIAVQPVEIWWPTWERTFTRAEDDQQLALRAMFEDPIDNTRNTGIQYLMWMLLGDSRTRELILTQGVMFAGGYPEVLFEIFGPDLGWAALVGLSLLYGLALRQIAYAVLRGQVLTALSGTYMLFTAGLLFIGGMLNWLVAWTFWLKFATFLGAVMIETWWLARFGAPLIPWTFSRRSVAAGAR